MNRTDTQMINLLNSHSLLEPADSILIAIDVQPVFLDKLSPARSNELLTNICWLVQLARWLEIPMVITAEEMAQQPVAPQLLELLPDDQPIFDKLTFGLADQPNILAAVEQIGRKTAILIGLETDVCVLHSALGLLERGYRVAVVVDAVGTPEPHHEIGLARMRSAGVVMVDRKGLFYEWLRTVEQVNRFHQALPHMRGLVRNDF